MRNYIVHYLAEINDQCQDLEYPLQAIDFEGALVRFNLKVRVFKRITKIEEI